MQIQTVLFATFWNFFFLNIFALQLVESANAEPVDKEDRLYGDDNLLCGYLYAYTPDPWTTQVWKAQVHLYVVFLFNKYTVCPLCAYVESVDAKGWLKGTSASLDIGSWTGTLCILRDDCTMIMSKSESSQLPTSISLNDANFKYILDSEENSQCFYQKPETEKH